ncbi:hypothetical protein PIROE2DRAFT_1985 [Piromyces sp. E2]|nr:hypothetical protein PIROE2DRAFT_1985 [Piromyces sp. E2]|eukprot:OUM70036.1 hypothetical protein PIROE2DRAFT_1985 [Piromyces sp. E2]
MFRYQSKSKTDSCISFLNLNEKISYYYIYKNDTVIVNVKIKDLDSYNKGISFKNIDGLSDSYVFTCAEEADFKRKTITFSDKYKIEVPISDDETIILKSMSDIYKFDINEKVTDEMNCSIMENTLNIAKPLQVYK